MTEEVKQPNAPGEALEKTLGALPPLPLSPEVSVAVLDIQTRVGKLQTVRKYIQKELNAGQRRLLKKIGKQRQPTDLEKRQLKDLEIDFGTIPGVNKPFLKQPGAEKIAQWLRVRPIYETEVTPVPGHEGHVEVHGRCRLFAVGTQVEVFCGPLASCSTMESNYRYRWIDMAVQPTYDWSQKEGKIAKALGTHRSFKRTVKGNEEWVWQERRENPNIYDERNKVRQIGEKRMLVKSIRNWGALSEIFTEDPSEWVLDDESNTSKTASEPTPAEAGSIGSVKREEPAAAAPAQEQAKPSPEVLTVEIRWPSDTSEVALISIPECPAGLELATRLRDFADFRKDVSDGSGVWVCPASYIPDVAEYVTKNLGMKVKEVELGKVEKPAAPAAEVSKDPVPQGAKSAGTNVPAPTKGKVSHVSKHPGAKKNQFYYLVVIGNRSLYCYKVDWFEHLAKAKDKECQFEVQDGAYPKLVGLVQIGDVSFEDNIPVIQQKDR